jgi:hypothetical protein
MLGEAVNHRPQVEGGLADPVCEHRAAQLDPGASIDLRLARHGCV